MKFDLKITFTALLLFVFVSVVVVNFNRRLTKISTTHTGDSSIAIDSVGSIIQGGISVVDQLKELKDSGVLDKIDHIVKDGVQYNGVDIVIDSKVKSYSKKSTYCYNKTTISYSRNNQPKEDMIVIPGERRMVNGVEMAMMQIEDGDEVDIYVPDIYNGNYSFLSKKSDSYNTDSDQKTKLHKYSIQIKSIDDPVIIPENYQVIITKRNNKGIRTICGAAVILSLNIKDQKGNELFNSEQSGDLMLNLGHSKIPFGIEKAILTMKAGESATVILPVQLMKYHNMNNQSSLVSVKYPEKLQYMNHNLEQVEQIMSTYNQDIAIINLTIKQVIF